MAALQFVPFHRAVTPQRVNTAPDLGRALVANPSLQMLVLNAYLHLAHNAVLKH
jgi:hypothetical protein